MTRRRVSDVMFFVWLAAGGTCVAALALRSVAVAVAAFAVSFAAYTVGWFTCPYPDTRQALNEEEP